MNVNLTIHARDFADPHGKNLVENGKLQECFGNIKANSLTE